MWVVPRAPVVKALYLSTRETGNSAIATDLGGRSPSASAALHTQGLQKAVDDGVLLREHACSAVHFNHSAVVNIVDERCKGKRKRTYRKANVEVVWQAKFVKDMQDLALRTLRMSGADIRVILSRNRTSDAVVGLDAAALGTLRLYRVPALAVLGLSAQTLGWASAGHPEMLLRMWSPQEEAGLGTAAMEASFRAICATGIFLRRRETHPSEALADCVAEVQLQAPGTGVDCGADLAAAISAACAAAGLCVRSWMGCARRIGWRARAGVRACTAPHKSHRSAARRGNELGRRQRPRWQGRQ